MRYEKCILKEIRARGGGGRSGLVAAFDRHLERETGEEAADVGVPGPVRVLAVRFGETGRLSHFVKQTSQTFLEIVCGS